MKVDLRKAVLLISLSVVMLMLGCDHERNAADDDVAMIQEAKTRAETIAKLSIEWEYAAAVAMYQATDPRLRHAVDAELRKILAKTSSFSIWCDIGSGSGLGLADGNVLNEVCRMAPGERVSVALRNTPAKAIEWRSLMSVFARRWLEDSFGVAGRDAVLVGLAVNEDFTLWSKAERTMLFDMVNASFRTDDAYTRMHAVTVAVYAFAVEKEFGKPLNDAVTIKGGHGKMSLAEFVAWFGSYREQLLTLPSPEPDPEFRPHYDYSAAARKTYPQPEESPECMLSPRYGSIIVGGAVEGSVPVTEGVPGRRWIRLEQE